ncbi:alpha/beta hydrolase fold domain-containing protein [Nocardia sp. NPDC058058]|uniref:alpha/beta hydrolase fold domain-containing protein n=1 Tax=Nocardia sp. NPDC058058 TaxID=3346317 RepID=UPI0036D81093
MASIRAELLTVVVRALRVRRKYDGAQRIRATIAADRAKGPAVPSAKIRGRVSVREMDFRGRGVFVLSPRTAASGTPAIYLHGGGWVEPIADPHWELIEALVQRLDRPVAVPMYPLAPECTADEVFAWLLPFYADIAGGDAPVLLGDSAGANLALSLTIQAIAEGLTVPSALVLLSPCLDATLSDPRLAELEPRDPILPVRGVAELARLYAGERAVSDPLISPMFADLTGVPPIALFTGTRDILNVDAHRFRSRAAEFGIELAWHEYPGMLHAWPLFPIPEAERAIGEMVEFLTGVLVR